MGLSREGVRDDVSAVYSGSWGNAANAPGNFGFHFVRLTPGVKTNCTKTRGKVFNATTKHFYRLWICLNLILIEGSVAPRADRRRSSGRSIALCPSAAASRFAGGPNSSMVTGRVCYSLALQTQIPLALFSGAFRSSQIGASRSSGCSGAGRIRFPSMHKKCPSNGFTAPEIIYYLTCMRMCS